MNHDSSCRAAVRSLATKRLLLVDDEDSIRESAALSLERGGGWDVLAIASGTEAVELCGGGEIFDAILLDATMPGLDGPTTLEWLRADGLSDATPVVFLTAKPHPADFKRLQALGLAGVIAKPFDPMRLPAELEKVLESCPARCERIRPELTWAWRRARPAIEERLGAIEAALGSPAEGESLEAGVTAAHMLAGLLSTFGLRRGTTIARRIEVALQQGGADSERQALHALAGDLRAVVEAGRSASGTTSRRSASLGASVYV